MKCGTNATPPSSEDSVFNCSEQLRMTVDSWALSRMARSSTVHFQLELQGTLENRSLLAGGVAFDILRCWKDDHLQTSEYSQQGKYKGRVTNTTENVQISVHRKFLSLRLRLLKTVYMGNICISPPRRSCPPGEPCREGWPSCAWPRATVCQWRRLGGAGRGRGRRARAWPGGAWSGGRRAGRARAWTPRRAWETYSRRLRVC